MFVEDTHYVRFQKKQTKRTIDKCTVAVHLM